ncbi:hypothetical protein LHT11_04045 [Acetobacter indonesiensis]|uniref:hypothetical protein n=1 Tax=Acetobacter indonesiensis TaxID=104101 RepID=UPI001F2692F2|nr:hypothetical protein [Acetobacter indonesiensis]MCG0994375.1 hypothetical protein [Acetobacter indonesiensis]
MIIVDHRRNEIKQIHETKKRFGAEIDLRNHGDNILVTHDPFITDAPSLEEWLTHFDHSFLIANVKEEGLEDRLLSILKKYNVENYFILDESFPFIRKYALKGISNFALRVSEFENYRTALALAHSLKDVGQNVDWIWADSFTGEPLQPDTAKALRDVGFKICAVSPELHHVAAPDTWEERVSLFQLKLQEPTFLASRPDMVCSKLVEKWEHWANINV